MDLKTLRALLEVAWCAETASGYWSPLCPSLNQCAKTALIVQDHFGGDMLRCLMTNSDSHYWNRLPNGTEIDLTLNQFDFIAAKPLKNDYVVRPRKYVLSFPNTVIGYELLKARLNTLIKIISPTVPAT